MEEFSFYVVDIKCKLLFQVTVVKYITNACFTHIRLNWITDLGELYYCVGELILILNCVSAITAVEIALALLKKKPMGCIELIHFNVFEGKCSPDELLLKVFLHFLPKILALISYIAAERM